MQKSLVLTLTFFSFAQIHGTRTLWSYMQKYLRSDDYTKKDTGDANLAFLFTYGLGMNILGPILCRINLKLSVALGCISTAIVFTAIGYLQQEKKLTYSWIILLMILNGLSQSTCYPGCVNILGNWFRNAKVGILMGIWSGCTNFGDIDGLIIGDRIVQRSSLDYSWAFYIIAISLYTIGLLDLLFLKAAPDSKQKDSAIEPLQSLLDKESNYTNQSNSMVEQSEKQSQIEQRGKVNIFNAWCLPGVAIYAFCYGCLKGTFVGLLYWLPDYLQNDPQLEEQSSYIAQMFDVGTFIGGVFIGLLGDVYKRRAIFISPSILIAIILMLMIRFILKSDPLPYYFVVLGIGFFQGGPYNNISGVISIELTTQLKNDKAAISIVSSLIESVGTLTAASFQLILSRLEDDQLFLFFTLVTVVAEFTTLVLLYQECTKKKDQK